ncbi:MAG: sel1 repeat family protein [Deltaproteobacteria bacterium]|jgi:TPR repeat protein|nr:sel1 repeat family protein [Deltaproteobacteria bacterium]
MRHFALAFTIFSLFCLWLALGASDAAAQAAKPAAKTFQGLDLSKYKLPSNFDALSDPEKVLILKTQDAEKGDAQAMLELGATYEQGNLAPRDYTKALDWYKKAAEKDLPAAFYSVGMCYLIGQGDAPNLSLALDNLRRASIRGFPMADFQLAIFSLRGENVKKNVAEGIKLLKKAADSGLLPAINELGVISYNGLWEQRIDKTAAFEYFAKGAEAGYGESMRNLAVCYLNGEGQTKNVVQSLKWFILARDVGYMQPEMDRMVQAVKNELNPTQIAQAEGEAKAWIDALVSKINALQQAANAEMAKQPEKPAAAAAPKAPAKKPAAKPTSRGNRR